ncbi:DUF1905 domain-containing protein [Tissierella carlieri]|jgi:hypothetical protein|uniref:DUF1905 domain-containing protein n=1 Tax=Tissierella TaxID=41273 RepID=UPI0028054C34|nr:DUF1905 domain-containing protein [uncultured Tissierella sp.]MDU5080822.1 DUF1905 domain-containing protein [Bacillota bacterium]
MQYTFRGSLLKEGAKTFISIPFNVWEVLGQKGLIPVNVTINDFNFECKLVPKGNGNYYIPIVKDVLKIINSSEELDISFEVISHLARINNNSPYSIEDPIRKIDRIEIIKSGDRLCGQGCVAMLAGVSIDEVIILMKAKTSLSKVIEALDYYGIGHSDKMVYKLKKDHKLPKCCIINTSGHLILFYDGKYYDSSIGILEDFDLNKITGYLEIIL